MTQNQKIFLLVAETLSISKTAQKAFITQQCVSDHIKRIEEEFGTKLFHRKPYMHLTPAGEVVFNSLNNIALIEKNLTKSISDFSNERKGSFSVGMSTTRSKLLIPLLMKRYHQLFPDVEVSFFSGDTKILEENLLHNKLDIFLGINTSLNLGLNIEHICEDYLYLVINKKMFNKYFSQYDLKKFKKGVDLKYFEKIPMTLYNETGALNTLLQQHLLTHGIELNNVVCYTSECDVQIDLCLNNVTSAIIPKMLANNFLQNNEIYFFPIKDFNYPLRVDIVSNPYLEKPLYLKAFISILKEELVEFSMNSF
ncbi:MAG: LysR family transcriptional regulator [Peptoniphilus lacydonensis]|uniref:LysR family transcriptional regulator n=1 Tax=Peptoniphilus lacydonensis TaxID=1673725 RepID=UPI0028FEB739|nr:LysR family transcriptional regulator [Peptoniphilus lacydonensis]MDU1954847.1 LysR family transcriptional regulator [Peptoniphilus lacydonensis]MDU2114782.1 LysR family transcriptional regulator [Peptoniphilus lacydonensis]MDU5274346.1 LysR family transcriptional regulator [Peptoniphilus lacydonensis]